MIPQHHHSSSSSSFTTKYNMKFIIPTQYHGIHGMHGLQSSSTMTLYSKDDEDDEEDEYIDDEALGDWRSFRNSLVETGISSPSIQDGYVSESPQPPNEKNKDVPNSSSSSLSSSTNTNTNTNNNNDNTQKKQRKSVSKENEELLEQQNEKLAQEYKSGVWAHTTTDVETGGLVVRMPLEAEIYHSGDTTPIGQLLQRQLDGDDSSSDSQSVFSSMESSSSSSSSSRVDNDDTESTSTNNNNNNNNRQSFSLAAAKTILWYKKTSNFIDEYMQKVAKAANTNGEVDPNSLPSDCLDLLNLYLDNQERWQEVCLVTQKDVMEGTAKTLVINRPMAFTLSSSLAKLVLFGAMSAVSDKTRVSETQLLVQFLNAFGDKCAVYVGGKDNMDRPATMIHGIQGLEGAKEISPGTKIYQGGLNAAIKGITAGKYNPMDFRFFVGCNEYKNGELDTQVSCHKYQPIACARSVVLKQCIQLPKPLWHEVIELCGGELKELSHLELMKRADLK